MNLLQFILATLGLMGCLYLWNAYVAPQPMKLFGTIVLLLLVIIVILSFCGVLPLLGLRV